MGIFNFIVGLVISFLMNPFIIKFVIKINPVLFYALYRYDIDCIFRKYDKKRCKMILKDELKEFNIEFIDKDDDIS